MMFAKNALPPLLFSLTLLALGGNAASAQQAQTDDARNYQLQLGPHFMIQYNSDEPLLDISKTMRLNWVVRMNDDTKMSTEEALALGLIDPATGLPLSMPDGAYRIDGGKFLTPLKFYPQYFSDDYTIEWEGDADVAINFLNDGDVLKRGKNSIEFFVPTSGPKVRQLFFTKVGDGGVKGYRIYRSKYKSRLNAGEIWNPVFVDDVRRYDVVRTMDFQSINASPVRRFSDIAKLDSATFANGFKSEWPGPAYFGTPYEALFDLAIRADTKLWTHVPLMIGSPVHLADPALRRDDKPAKIDPKKVKEMSRTHSAEILASPEWPVFAKEFADRLVASGYPKDRPLYIELGNEIWNQTGGFALHTNYAAGVGAGINRQWEFREGYGALSAVWAAALEAELAKRQQSYNITYVLASHTAWPQSTSLAIEGYKHQLQALGADVDAIVGKTGIALTTYSKCLKKFSNASFGKVQKEELTAAWDNAIKEDPEGLKKRLHDFCVDGSAATSATRNWVVAIWKKHQIKANEGGMKIIGAYEGGSHDLPRGSMFKSKSFGPWWKEYQWGPYGADVTRQVNLSLAEAFPGVILSNYVSTGPIGNAPWHDGHYSEPTDKSRMWDEFKRPEHE